jgi:hypothetical protein
LLHFAPCQESARADSKNGSGLASDERGISVLDTLRVRHLAHQLWEQQGRPNGQELDHWLEAERRLSKDHKALGKLKSNKRDVDGKKKKKKG